MGLGDEIKTAGIRPRRWLKSWELSRVSISLVHAPAYYFDLFTDLPDKLKLKYEQNVKSDLIHYFTQQKEEYVHVAGI